MKTTYHITFLSACLIFSCAQAAWAKLNIASLQEMVSVAAKDFQGTLGVGVLDAQTGESWYYNGDEHFRMQSVAKLPIAIAALHKVDAGKLKLQQEIALTKTEVFMIRNAAIPDAISPATKTATLASLIERSICRSNNGASDVLTKILGGPASVNAFLRDAKIAGIRIDRYEAEVSQWDDQNKGAALLDSTTPRALCTLLYKLKSGKLLSAHSTDYLLDLMRHCETGDHRIRAGFPKDWIIADKTGTGRQIKGINVATNDVAIITQPDKSCWILAVFVADAKLNRAECENKIAEIAQTLYRAIE